MRKAAGHLLSILSFSPDGRWAVVQLYRLPFAGDAAAEFYLAPLRQDDLAPRAEWTPLPVRTAFPAVPWSSGGNALYFFGDTPERDSIEILPLDFAPKPIAGAGHTFYRFQRPSFLVLEGGGLVAAGERLIFPALESKGNIWLMQLPR